MIWFVVDRKVFCTIELFAVYANWNVNNGGWNVNANSVANPNEWNAGNMVMSRNYYFFSSTLYGGVFV